MGIRARWDVIAQRFSKDGQAHRVALAKHKSRKTGCDGTRVLELSAPAQAKRHGATAIEDDNDLQTGLLDVLLDEIAVALSEDLPIDQPNLVAGNVTAMLREFRAAAFEFRTVLARQQAIHHAAGK